MEYRALSVKCVIPPLSLRIEEGKWQGGRRQRRYSLVSNLDRDTGDYRKKGLGQTFARAKRVASGGFLEIPFQNWCENAEWEKQGGDEGGGKSNEQRSKIILALQYDL